MRPFKPEEKRFLILCVVVLVLVAAASILMPGIGLLSCVNKWGKLQKELAVKREELTKAKAKEASVTQLQANIADAESRIALVERRLPNDKDAPQLFKDLNDLARETNQKYMSMLAKPVQEKGTYIEIPLQVNLRAGYHDLGRYINLIERSQRFAKIDGLDIKYDFEDPFFNAVDLTVSTFMFHKQAPKPSSAASAQLKKEES